MAYLTRVAERGGGAGGDNCPRFWHMCHGYHHGSFTLKHLRLPVLNETHRNSYTGPRLFRI
jgi:hypothetical protein